MKPESKHTTRLKLLQRWFSGEATYRDEQELDALAKDDPFVAEAMEGYRSLPDDDHALAVLRLKARLRQRYGKKRRGIVFYTIRVAAIGTLLVATWLVLQQFNQREMNAGGLAEIAKETAPMPADTIQPSAGPVVPKGEETVSDAAATLPKDLQPEPVEPPVQNEPMPAHLKTAEAHPQEPTPAVASANESPAADSSIGAKEAGKPAAGEVFQEEAAAVPRISPAEKKRATRRITGRVTDSSGVSLIGASVLDKSTGRVTQTDIDGNFDIEVGDSSNTLTINFIGLESREVPLGADSFIEVQLEDNADQLSEVAVTGRKARRSKKLDSSAAATTTPSPKRGFKRFKKYLHKKMRYPESAAQNNVEGTVTLSFRIDAGGKPTDIAVLESLGFGCDAEAIRLLKEGPKWAPAGMAVYSIEFKL